MDKIFFGSINSGDVKIHYSRTSNELPPVVMLHGLTDNGLCLSRLAYAIYKSYDVFLPDARGHGLSDAPGRGYDVMSFAGDVKELIGSLELKKPAVIGHSMGAATTARLAADFPELIRGIVLIDPPWFDEAYLDQVNYDQRKTGYEESIRKDHSMTLPELEQRVREEHPNWHEDELLNWSKSKLQVKEEVVPIIRSIVEDWQLTAERIQCPTLLLTGNPEKGAIITGKTIEKLKKMHNTWKILTFPESGHNIHRDAFDPCKKAILDFLRDIH